MHPIFKTLARLLLCTALCATSICSMAESPAAHVNNSSKPSIHATVSGPKGRHRIVNGGAASRLRHIPLVFETNRGQTDPRVAFLSHNAGSGLFLSATEATFSAPATEPNKKVSTIRMNLLKGNSRAVMHGDGVASSKVNYIIGNDPKRWKTGIEGYGRVRADNVYPGIDLAYYGNEQQLEYDFIVAPHADPDAIKFAFDGARSVKLNHKGDLIISTRGSLMSWHRPVTYQQINGKRVPIDSRYTLSRTATIRASGRRISAHSSVQVAFELGRYDRTRPLIIDPTLAYCSYLGGNGSDLVTGAAMDGSNHFYITGHTYSNNFPTVNAYQPTNLTYTSSPYSGGFTGFIAKMDLSRAGASSMIYCTYIGGTQGAWPYGIAVDPTGNAYITGGTASPDFPLVRAYLTSNPGSQGFIFKLSPDGSTPLYSTFFGGATGGAPPTAIAADGYGQVYVAGTTYASDLPTSVTSFKAHTVGSSAFLAKLNTLLYGPASLIYCTYIGDPTILLGRETATGVAVDSLGHAYITGVTLTSTFPILGGFQSGYGGNTLRGAGDGYLVKLNIGGTGLLYSTFIGGTGTDQPNAVTVDATGNALVVGQTDSTDFPIYNAFQPTNTSLLSAFVTKINTNAVGSASLMWSTYLSGGYYNYAYSAVYDTSGNVYVGGSTTSLDFPVTQLFPPNVPGQGGAFVTEIAADGSHIMYSTAISGWTGDCFGGYIAIDTSGSIYLTGFTRDDSGLPITSANAFQPAHANDESAPGYLEDCFVAKIVPDSLDLALTEVSSAPGIARGSSVKYTLAVKNNGPVTATNVVLRDALTSNFDPDSPFSFGVLSTTTPQGSVTVSGGNVTFNIGTINSGQTIVVTVTVGTSGVGFGSITSAATVTCDERDSNLTNNSASIGTSVLRPTPTLLLLNPSTVSAGGGSFTLNVTGTDIPSGAQVAFNGSILPGSVVLSSTQISATVPGSLVTTAGTAHITIVGPSGAVSNAGVLLIGTPALRAAVSVSHIPLGGFKATITFTNSGSGPANSIQITGCTLHSIGTTSSLPYTVGTLSAGSSATAYLNFPSSAGSSGLTTTMTITAAYAGGTFSSTVRVTLP